MNQQKKKLSTKVIFLCKIDLINLINESNLNKNKNFKEKENDFGQENIVDLNTNPLEISEFFNINSINKPPKNFKFFTKE